MAKHAAVSLKLVKVDSRRDPLGEQLNRRVLQTLHELAEDIKSDPGIEDEYEFEMFDNTGPAPSRAKKKKK